MKLNFGENIRKLRIEHGLTQEKLADFLGVSFQAVSKWERGDTVPDIFMLPTIAAFFGVTTDHLLCFDQIEMEKDIEKYEALYYQLWQKNDREALLKKMQEAVRQYPAEFRLLVRYLNVMAWYAGVSSDNALAVKNEVISVYERIQSHCTTDSIRIWAKKIMCDYCLKLCHIPGSGVALDDVEKIQSEMPLMQNSRDYLACFLYSDERRDSACKAAVSELLFLLNNVITENWIYNSAHSLQERIKVLETLVQANKAFYSEEDYGKNYLNMAYATAHLGCLYYEAEDSPKAAEKICESLRLANNFDSLHSELLHTSPLLDGFCIEKTKIPKVHEGALYERIIGYVFDKKKVPKAIVPDGI